MKMRQLKQYHVAQILWRNWWLYQYYAVRRSFQQIDEATGNHDWVGHTDPELVKFADSIGNDTMSLGELFREAAGIEAAKVDPMITEFLSGPSVHSIMAVEAAKVEFVCVKVSDGSVVDTFDTREDAQDLVDKHVRGKKAKLEILETA